MSECEHSWLLTGWQDGTAYGGGKEPRFTRHITLDCVLCGAFGTIDEPTKKEWVWNGPCRTGSYPWPFFGDPARVTIRELREF